MTRWQDYEEKLEKVSGNDELLINSGGIVKRVQAIQFKGDQGLRGIGISRIESRKTGKNTFVEVFNTENVKIGSFTVSDGENGKNGENGLDGSPGVDGQDGENGVGIVNISTNKEGKTTTLRIELSNGKNYEFSIQDGIDGTGAGDMLAENNLSDLANKIEARKNLSVYSKNETNSKIISEIAKTTRFVLAEDGKQLSEQNFSLNEKRKLESLKFFSGNYNDLTNKPIIPNIDNLVKHQTTGIGNYWSPKIMEVRTKGGKIWVLGARQDDNGSFRFETQNDAGQYRQIRFGRNGSLGLNTGFSGNLAEADKPALAIGYSNTGFRKHPERLEGFYGDTRAFRFNNDWIEFNSIPTTTRPQHHFGHSLTRKDYVDGLIANIPKIAWKTENINSRSEYQEFTHNLNIQEWEFFEGRYSIVAFMQDGNRLTIISTLYNDYGISGNNAKWQNNYTDYSNSFGVFHNKIYVRTGNSLLRRILIFKNY